MGEQHFRRGLVEEIDQLPELVRTHRLGQGRGTADVGEEKAAIDLGATTLVVTHDVAETKVEQVRALAKKNEFPLLCTMEPE